MIDFYQLSERTEKGVEPVGATIFADDRVGEIRASEQLLEDLIVGYRLLKGEFLPTPPLP